MTNVIQVCSNFRGARVFIKNTRPDEVATPLTFANFSGETRGVRRDSDGSEIAIKPTELRVSEF
jgi:hypothetical protein